jgi:alanine dehydrogenase
VVTLASNAWTIRETLRQSDLVIGAVLVPGAAAPRLLSRGMLSGMRPGAVIVDVCIDQGGCLETSRPTSHSDPVFTVDGIVHYCVSNMPAAVPHTSTFALTNATIPYLLQIAGEGLETAATDNLAILEGVNTYQGHVTHPAVAESQRRPYRELSSLI